MAERIKSESFTMKANEHQYFGGVDKQNGTIVKLNSDFICVGGQDKKIKLLRYSDLSLVANLDVEGAIFRTALLIGKHIYILCANK